MFRTEDENETPEIELRTELFNPPGLGTVFTARRVPGYRAESVDSKAEDLKPRRGRTLLQALLFSQALCLVGTHEEMDFDKCV